VRAELRGGGIGSALFDRALDRAGGRAVGLDGVLAQQSSYERRGFELAHHNVRWRTTATADQGPADLVELSSVPLDQLLAYDAGVFGTTRREFLRAWIDRPPGRALACVADERLVGYGVLRQCAVGDKVGPLFADDAEVADWVLTGLLAAAPQGGDVFIDMPAANPQAERLRATRVIEPAFETVRMYRGGRPTEDTGRVFGVTTFEFG
jgi:hypothetical protein